MATDKTQRELLLVEYKVAHDGYKSRDVLIPREFSYMLQAFVIFLSLITAARAFLTFDHALAVVVFLLLGITGLICLVAFLIDIQANTSCKKALRKRSTEIEKILKKTLEKEFDDDDLQHWQIILKRKMFFEESLLKSGQSDEEPKRSTASGFVWVARLLVFLWIVLVILVIFWGQALNLNG